MRVRERFSTFFLGVLRAERTVKKDRRHHLHDVLFEPIQRIQGLCNETVSSRSTPHECVRLPSC